MLAATRGSASGVRLAPLGPEHAAATERWASDPEIATNVGIRRAVSRESTAAWVADAQADEGCLPFAIVLDDEHVGNVVLDHIDRGLGTARLSIYVGAPSARGRGVGQAAVRMAVRTAFHEQELFKVWLTVHARNAAAIAAYARCGFAVEGVLRGEFILEGERIDALRMSVCRTDAAAP